VIIVNTHQAKTQLSSLLLAVEERGEEVWICRHGKPVAELKQIPRKSRGSLKKSDIANIKFFEDPMAPLSDEDWPEVLR